MKIIIGYPPLISTKGTPLLSQNRQFQWFKSPTYIYPVVPAYSATMLKNSGHQVFWLDGIAQNWTLEKWLAEVKKQKADLLMMETKTPVIKQHWKIINHLKSLSIIPALPAGRHHPLSIILVGDHVTALPEESFKNSQVDYILTGGDYDFLLLNLINHLTKGVKLEPGIWYRKSINYQQPARSAGGSTINNTGRFKLNHNLNSLPIIDRELTRWKLYAYQNGNYKKTPGTYIMAGRDCWHRKNYGCTFCSWTTLYPQYRVRTVANVLAEVGSLINQYQIKEVMDDTGTFPVGQWLKDFCEAMIKLQYNKKIYFSCNMRFGVLGKIDYLLMAKAGFRMLLYGLESANQTTLDKLNKGIRVDLVEKELAIIKQVNNETNGYLQPHLTCMIGYPWETKKQALNTLNFAKNLFKKALIDSLQATMVIPYPGTKLFNQAQKNHWLKTLNWNDYDMKQPVLKTKIANKEILQLIQSLYISFLTPKFIFKKMINTKSVSDIKYLFKAAFKILGHLIDFKK